MIVHGCDDIFHVFDMYVGFCDLSEISTFACGKCYFALIRIIGGMYFVGNL